MYKTIARLVSNLFSKVWYAKISLRHHEVYRALRCLDLGFETIAIRTDIWLEANEGLRGAVVFPRHPMAFKGHAGTIAGPRVFALKKGKAYDVLNILRSGVFYQHRKTVA